MKMLYSFGIGINNNSINFNVNSKLEKFKIITTNYSFLLNYTQRVLSNQRKHYYQKSKYTLQCSKVDTVFRARIFISECNGQELIDA